MRYWSCALIVVVLGAGCARQSGEKKDAAGPAGPGGPVAVGDDTFAPQPAPQAPSAAPAADSAVQWERQLIGKDATARQQAARALQNLGEPGFPSLFRTIQSGSPEARKAALEAVNQSMLTAHAKQLLPLLGEMLHDRDPAYRTLAVTRISALGKVAVPALADLRRMSKTDSDPGVRQAAEHAAQAVDYAVTGIWPPEWGEAPKKQ